MILPPLLRYRKPWASAKLPVVDSELTVALSTTMSLIVPVFSIVKAEAIAKEVLVSVTVMPFIVKLCMVP